MERSIPPEEVGHMITFVSHTEDPYTSEEVEELLARHRPATTFDVDPRRLRTMHAGISERFSDGRLIADTAAWLEEDRARISRLPAVTVRVVEMRIERWERDRDAALEPGDQQPAGAPEPPQQQTKRDLRLFAEDHRRVVAARLAGIQKMKAQFVTDPIARSKFTTTDNGMSVEVRRYEDIQAGRHQRTNRSTLPGSAHTLA
jgi:hypothetical protein